MLRVQPADDAALGTLEDLDDAAQRPAARVLAGDAHRGAVAVQHLAHLGGGQEHPRAAVVGREKAVAVAVALDAPRGDGDALRHQETAGAVLHHAPGFLQLGERVEKARALARADGKSAQQLVARQRRAGALERVEDFAGVGRGRAGGALNGPGASVL